MSLQICVSRLLDENSPSLETVKMQVHFDMNYSTRGTHSHRIKCILYTCVQVYFKGVKASTCVVSPYVQQPMLHVRALCPLPEAQQKCLLNAMIDADKGQGSTLCILQ